MQCGTCKDCGFWFMFQSDFYDQMILKLNKFGPGTEDH